MIRTMLVSALFSWQLFWTFLRRLLIVKNIIYLHSLGNMPEKLVKCLLFYLFLKLVQIRKHTKIKQESIPTFLNRTKRGLGLKFSSKHCIYIYIYIRHFFNILVQICIYSKIYIIYLRNIFEQVIRYNLVWGSLCLINHEAVYEKRKLYQTRLYMNQVIHV